MKKKLLIVLLVVLVLALALFLVACNNDTPPVDNDGDNTGNGGTEPTVEKFAVTFKNGDIVLKTEEVEKGKSATAPAEPTKESTEQYNYEFRGWDKDFSNVTSDLVVNAEFTESVRKYEVKFIGGNGEVLDTQYVEYGKSAVAPANPTREDTDEFIYRFENWNVDFTNITSDLEVVAQFTEIDLTQFTFTLINNDTEYSIQKNGAIFGDIIIPSTYMGKPVTNIGDKAFYDCNLTSVEIPASVTSIGDYAFNSCGKLTSITIPDSVTSIGNNAFCGCGGVKSVLIPDSVISIGERAFDDCGDGKIILYAEAESQPSGWEYFYSGDYSVEYWGVTARDIVTIEDITYVRQGNSAVVSNGVDKESVKIKDKVTINEKEYIVKGIGAFAFYKKYNKYLTNIEIPNSVIDIGNWAFACCYKLKYNEYDNALYLGNSGNPYVALIEVKDDTITSCEININTKSISFGAFSWCEELTDITIPNGVLSIGDNAFYGCYGLTSITIPSSVTSIGNKAFGRCNVIGELEIPSSVEFIGDMAFNLSGGSITSIKVAENNRNYKSVNNCLLTKDGTKLILGCKNSVIPNGVTSIGEAAFYNCSGLTSVTIPDSVTSIGSDAFTGCSSLISVKFAENSQLKSLGDYAFRECSSLRGVTIPNSVISIGDEAFYNCSGLTSVTIPSSVTSIGDNAFDCCYGLTIYCEVKSKPSGWSSSWNYDNRPVVWGI